MTNQKKTINLLETNSSLKFEETLGPIDLLQNLGKIQDGINTNITIKKISKDLFLAEGSIAVVFKSECQKCFEKTKIDLDLKIKVGIKDKILETSDKKGPLDIHYQFLESFDMNQLIAEEIHLNYPSFIYCCTDNESKENEEKREEIHRPFKKIRDLIK